MRRDAVAGAPVQSPISTVKRGISNPVPMMTPASTSASSTSSCSNRRARVVAAAVAGPVRTRSIHDAYSATNVCAGLGNTLSIHVATGVAARINSGVVSVVTADTATAI